MKPELFSLQAVGIALETKRLDIFNQAILKSVSATQGCSIKLYQCIVCQVFVSQFLNLGVVCKHVSGSCQKKVCTSWQESDVTIDHTEFSNNAFVEYPEPFYSTKFVTM